MIGVAASGSAVGKLNICAQQHIVVVFLNVWCCELHLLHKLFNSHESGFNLFGLIIDSTQRTCLCDRWAQTSDIEITSPTLRCHRHTRRHHMLSSSTLDSNFVSCK